MSEEGTSKLRHDVMRAILPAFSFSLTPEQKENVFQSFSDLSKYFALLQKESDRGLVSTINRKLPPLKLYLEDIEHMVDLLKPVSLNPTILTDEYEYANLSELQGEKQKVLRKLLITADTSDGFSIALNLKSDSADLSVIGAEQPNMRGVFDQVLDYLRERKEYAIMLSRFAFFCFLFLVASLAPLLFDRFDVTYAGLLIILAAVVAISTILGLTQSFLATHRYSTILLTYGSNAPSFWKRNWEKIAIAVVSGLINLVIGIILGWGARFLPGPPK
jgi:hypothetical protein